MEDNTIMDETTKELIAQLKSLMSANIHYRSMVKSNQEKMTALIEKYEKGTLIKDDISLRYKDDLNFR